MKAGCLTIILGFILVVVLIIAFAPRAQPVDHICTYLAKRGNWVGHDEYFFDRYEKNGNTHKLFCTYYDVLVAEVVVTDGYYFSILRRKQ